MRITVTKRALLNSMKTIKGWKSRHTAALKAREVSTDPRVSMQVDGTWIAVGDFFSKTGHSLYGIRGAHCWSGDMSETEQVDALGFIEAA